MATAPDASSFEEARYSRVAIWLHWIIAALIFANLLLGFLHDDFGRAATAPIMFFHKAFGITILGLSLARLVWRLGHRPPAYDRLMAAWEQVLARITHWLFYVLMIVGPLSGWILTSTSNRPIDYFGLFTIATLPVSRSEDVHEAWEEIHELIALAMLGLIVLHVAGAAKHHFEGHRHMIGRMAPWLVRKHEKTG